MRLGVFHACLIEWAEKPCVLTIAVASVGSELRLTGILRSYYSLHSISGWALVPPQQHGGFATMRLTQLNLEDATMREVVVDADRQRLRFSSRRDTVFELQRDDAYLTGPPRIVKEGRYLYVGGRRRPVPEEWMLT